MWHHNHYPCNTEDCTYIYTALSPFTMGDFHPLSLALSLPLSLTLSLALPAPARGGLSVPRLTQRPYVRQGDLNVGFFANVHHPSDTDYCSDTFSTASAIRQESIVWQIDQINARQDLLPNISLGFVILDTCFNTRTTLARAVYMLPAHSGGCEQEDGSPGVGQGQGSGYPGNNSQPYGTSPRSSSTPHDEEEPQHYKVVGVVGPAFSTAAVAVSTLLGLFEVPVLGTYATSDELADRARFPFFMRLSPADRAQSQALVDVLQRLQWTYVSLVYSEGPYGSSGSKNIERMAEAAGICIAYSRRVTTRATPTHYDSIVRHLASSGARAVVLFMENHFVTSLLDAVTRAGLAGRFVWVASDYFSSRGSYTNLAAAAGAIHVSINSGVTPGFAEYARTISWTNSTNPWLPQTWTQLFHCTWDNASAEARHCEDFLTLSEAPEYAATRASSRDMDGLYVYARALHALITAECPQAFSAPALLAACVQGRLLYQHMQNVSFQGYSGLVAFSPQGDVLGKLDYKTPYVTQYNAQNASLDRVIGEWDSLRETMTINVTQVDWTLVEGPRHHDNASCAWVVDSVCSYLCADDEYYQPLDLPCCWHCRRCRSNERVAGNTSGCAVCGMYTWPDPAHPDTCLPIPPTHLHITDTLSLILAAMAALGMLGSLAVQIFYNVHRSKRLLKASSIEISFLILLGTAAACAVVFLYISRPTQLSCVAREVGFHVTVSAIYCPLVVKTTRIYRIFTAGRQSVRKPRFVSRNAQAAMFTGLMMTQILVVILSEVLAPSGVELRQPLPTLRYVEAACRRPLWGFLLPLSTNIAVVLVCAALGFLTRRLPENFNESWFIFVSVSTTLFMWAVFLPTYFSAFYAYHQAALMGLCLLFNVYVTLAVQFGPRVYAVYYVQDDRITFNTTMATTYSQNAVAPVHASIS